MLQTIEQHDVHTRLGDTMSLMDAVALLSATLSPAWDVEQAIDPAGEASIIVSSAIDDTAVPAFILYEKEGEVVIATVRNDVWESEQDFTSYEPAAAAIIVEVTRTEMLGTGPAGIISNVTSDNPRW
jgi:hypothetical protein